MLLKEIFTKMYESNAARIKKLKYFMKENKKRLDASEARIERYGIACNLWYSEFVLVLTCTLSA